MPQMLPAQSKNRPSKISDLPEVRFNHPRVFLNVGLAYAGPFEYKERMIRKSSLSKDYISIFVFLATKAVHLEFVTSLSTPTFLSAFDRFLARRGQCKGFTVNVAPTSKALQITTKKSNAS